MENSTHPIETLFERLHEIRPYVGGMIEISTHFVGLGFFPGGDGLWKEPESTSRPQLPLGGVMVLGNNFQCTANYDAICRAGSEDRQRDATWRNLLHFLGQVDISPSRCFFTNAYMGLVAGCDSTRTVPGMRDAGFLERCRAFFLQQVRLIQPSVILALGTKVPPFLAPLSAETRVWCNATTWAQIDRNDGGLVRGAQFPGLNTSVNIACLLHPSFRGPNLHRRQFGAHLGAAAERAIVAAALKGNDIGLI